MPKKYLHFFVWFKTKMISQEKVHGSSTSVRETGKQTSLCLLKNVSESYESNFSLKLLGGEKNPK